ncbi:MAG: AMP-dependent synthetase and ligase [Myxococcaceae bacterium]|nr:AMP-dependent synthetase and ligase [Myxococcaceae bacterium]
MPAMSDGSNPLLRFVHARGPATAVFVDERAVSFAELDDLSAGVAAALDRRGVARGDRAALVLRSSLDGVACLLGCLRRGVVVVPVNPSYQEQEFAHVLADSGAALVIEDEACPALRAALDGRPVVSSRALLAEAPPLAAGDGPVHDDDLALLIYTSGTTGRSKGCAHTVAGLAAGVDALMALWGVTARDVVINALPLFHVHGLCVALLGALSRGAATRLVPRFSPEAVVDAARRGATVFMSVPTMVHRLLGALDDDGAAALGALRLVTCVSAALSAEHLRAFEARTGLTILERYGMSETLITLSNPLDGERRAGAVGWPVPGTLIRVVDDELQVSSPGTMKAYWQRPDADAESFVTEAEGRRWFKTGDVVALDDDGCVRIVGRASQDIMKVGGFKLSTREIEEQIEAHPAVREVAVVGLPDEEWGERVCAVVALRDGATLTLAELQAHVKLAEVKRPRALVLVDALPRNALGKVLKSALKARPAG